MNNIECQNFVIFSFKIRTKHTFSNCTLAIFAKSSILDVWLDSEYSSDFNLFSVNCQGFRLGHTYLELSWNSNWSASDDDLIVHKLLHYFYRYAKEINCQHVIRSLYVRKQQVTLLTLMIILTIFQDMIIDVIDAGDEKD